MALSKGEQTREHITQKTRALLVTKGFHNTSIAEILAATGVKKGNLYYHFASKEDLGLAVLEDAKEEFFIFLEKSFQGSDPIAKVINSCESIFKEQKKRNFVGGCLFGNTALEMSDCNEKFAEIIRDIFSTWTNRLTDYLVEARHLGLLGGTIPERLLAKTIVATIEGGIMMSRVSKAGQDLKDCLAALKAILGK
mgnify:CR=1 FL=1